MKLATMVLALLLGFPVTAAAVEDIRIDRAASEPYAYGNLLVYSKQQRPGVHRLMAYTGFEPHPVDDTPPSRTPFNADLGADRGGTRDMVYSRCRGGDCDVYIDEFVGRRERVEAIASRSCDEVAPSIWHKRIAFLRKGSGCRRPGVWVIDKGARRPRIVNRTTRATYTDLRSDKILWGGDWFLRVTRVSGRGTFSLRHDPPGEGEAWYIRSPAFGPGGYVYYVYAHDLEGEAGAIVRQQPVPGGRCERSNRTFGASGPSISGVAVGEWPFYTNRAGLHLATGDPTLAYTPGCEF